jgi:ADP-ribose pyrophosphatase
LALFTVNDRLGTQQIFKGSIFDVRVDTIRIDDGRQFTREVVEHPGGVCIACKPAPDEILLIKQYRYSINQELIELPAGRVDPGEDRLEAAKRELIEETGYRADRWSELPHVYSAPGFCDELLSCYLAQDVSWVGTNPDEDEDISVIRVKLKEAWQMVLDRSIRDCKTVAILGVLQSL